MGFNYSSREYFTKLQRSLKSRAICTILMTNCRAVRLNQFHFLFLRSREARIAANSSGLTRSFPLSTIARSSVLRHRPV